MKNHLIDVGEGLIFGLLFVVVLRLLNIETDGFQLAVLVGFSIFAVSILNSIGMHLKGQGVAKINEPAASVFTNNRTWTYKYGENTIEIKNTPTLCELIINGQVQDTIKGIISLSLKLNGRLPGGEEVKAAFKTSLATWDVTVNGEMLKAVAA